MSVFNALMALMTLGLLISSAAVLIQLRREASRREAALRASGAMAQDSEHP
ncbi:hypothetical protein [Halomonas nitroreducens]|uniref:hypothetical protein n=1 Tax=Halomonas nitroreducens TaxID=447425 RepID=UPI001639B435|nr:hypothetical protein [Halomonas nitroreducens]